MHIEWIKEIEYKYAGFISSALVLLLAFTTMVSGGGHETPQQVVTRYNNYKTICTGLGYQNVPCDAGNGGKSMFMFTYQNSRRYMAKILPIRHKTLSNHQSSNTYQNTTIYIWNAGLWPRITGGGGQGGTKVRWGVCMGPLQAPRRYRIGPGRGCKGAERLRSLEVLTIGNNLYY